MHLNYALVHFSESNHNYLNNCKSKLFDILVILFTLSFSTRSVHMKTSCLLFFVSPSHHFSASSLFSSVRSLLPPVGPQFFPRQPYPGLQKVSQLARLLFMFMCPPII